MGKKDPRVDEYIREAAPFARPILKHIRSLVHRACPKVEETIKWNAPFFMYDAKIVCVMAAFKAHCNFGFWKGRRICKADGSPAKVGVGQLGRITAVEDLPPAKLFAGYFKQAIALNAVAPKAARKAKPARRGKAPPHAPGDLLQALRANGKALAVFRDFSPTKQRDYVEWIVDAKTEATRERRLETAVEWIAQGKARHWKYER